MVNKYISNKTHLLVDTYTDPCIVSYISNETRGAGMSNEQTKTAQAKSQFGHKTHRAVRGRYGYAYAGTCGRCGGFKTFCDKCAQAFCQDCAVRRSA